METKPQYIKRLRSELTELGREIEKQIVRLNKLSEEIQHGYEGLETALMDRRELTEAKLEEESKSGEEAWHFVWDNVWGAVLESKLKTSTGINQNYGDLEPALQAKQSAMQAHLQVVKMSGNEVWNEIWNAVLNVLWRVIEAFNRQAAIELKQVGEELRPLLDKQAALQAELHEVLMSGDSFYDVLKGTTEAMVKVTSD
ncbi:MAG: hypothetical protein ABRQ23_09345 [Syntrophomonadaceae bacterium]